MYNEKFEDLVDKVEELKYDLSGSIEIDRDNNVIKIENTGFEAHEYDFDGQNEELQLAWDDFKADIAILKDHGLRTIYEKNQTPEPKSIYYEIYIQVGA